jgi:DNA polymerase III delta prime subunit
MELYKILDDDKYWKNKYMPKKIEDLDINNNDIKKIEKWLNDFLKNKEYNFQNQQRINKKQNLNNEILSNKYNNDPNKNCLLVSGPHGCGKTSMVISILNSLKYDVYTINFNKIVNNKNISDIIQKSINNRTITEKINNTESKKKILLIDNIESITFNNDKDFIIELVRYNEINWVFPIILISNNKHNKLLYLIKKLIYEIKLDKPTNEIIENILCKICMNENINLNDEKVLSKIVEYSQNDIRGLINMLQSIKHIYNNKKFKLSDFDEFIKSFKMKDIDYHIYDGTLKLFYGYDNIDNVIRLFELEKTVMPLMIQQHYVNYLKHSDDINKISKTIAYGDIIENYIYENNIYDIRDIQSFYQCVYPSYILTNKLNPKNLNHNNFPINFVYPYDLNKTSIRFINFTKNIFQANKVFTNMNLEDYLYLNKLLRGLLNSNKYSMCNEYLNGYKCSIQILESLLKIDKINGNKYLLTTKLKKKILANCESIVQKNNEIKKYKKNKKSKK